MADNAWRTASQSALGFSTPNSKTDSVKARRWLEANVPAVTAVKSVDPVGYGERWLRDPKGMILANVGQAMTDPIIGMIPPKGMLTPATIKRGEVYTPDVMGKSHYDPMAVEKRAIIPEGNTNTAGFIDETGTFMNRMQSLEWLKENDPNTYKGLDKVTRTNGLESQAYNNASGMITEEAALANEFMRRHYGK